MDASLLRRMEWEMVSKAALKSKRMRMDKTPESAAIKRSLRKKVKLAVQEEVPKESSFASPVLSLKKVSVQPCKDKKELCEDQLGVTPLETHTRGEDIYAAIKEILRNRGIDLKWIVSVTTDGAPAMVGKERGAVPRMTEDNPDLIAYHCLIHQTVLCASLSEHFAEVMNTMMKLINFLRASSSLQHRLLRKFLEDVEANANYLLLHNNVRWLSKDNALGRFWSVRKEITAFLEQVKSQKATQFSLFLQDEQKMDMVAFLVDITSHLNELNLKLQGQNNSVADLMTAVRSFQRKLDIFKEDLEGECEHFPKLQEQIQDERDVSPYVNFINKLIGNFSKRFNSFCLGQQLLLLIQNPFIIRKVRGFSKEVTQTFKWAHAGSLQLELIDLQGNAALREHFEATDPATFWLPPSLSICLSVKTDRDRRG
ncbi:general transcription factor II-I repeat domain-containing protein 2A-like [Epinephelus lanceolatus]